MSRKRRNSLILDLTKLKFKVVDKMDIDDVGNYIGYDIIAYNTGDRIKNTAILLHEFIEAILVYACGYTTKQLDKWDSLPRKRRPLKYQRAHKLANKIEKVFVESCGRDWTKHNEEIESINIKFN